MSITGGIALAEQPTGLGGGPTLLHRRSDETGTALCGESGDLVRGGVHTFGPAAQECPRCREIVDERAQEAAPDGGVSVERPAATIETTVPGVTTPVELSPLQVATVAGTVFLAGIVVGRML